MSATSGPDRAPMTTHSRQNLAHALGRFDRVGRELGVV
jgi:hypothetical protein